MAPPTPPMVRALPARTTRNRPRRPRAARWRPVARLVRRGLRFPVTVAITVIAAAVAGCATAPSGGPPRLAPGGNSQAQAYVQPLPPPGPTNSSAWTPQNVVLGFLHASASYAFDPAAARQYLEPELRRSWHPGPGVTVVGETPVVTRLSYNPKENLGSGQAASEEVVVHFTGQQLA